MAVAGRCGRRLKRSRRRRPSVRVGHAHLDQRQGCGHGEDEERAHADGPADRRQPEPEPEPGQSKEQPGNRRHRGQRRPQPLPQNRRPCPEQPAREHGLSRAGEAVAFRGFGGRFGQVGPATESLKGQYLSTEPVPGYGAWRFPKQFARHRDGKATDPAGQSQAGIRSSAINWSASRRGRTSAHSLSRTSTSGIKARVL